MLMNVYCDESCKDAHRYLALGAICLHDADAPVIVNALQEVRIAYGEHGEVKWTKNTPHKVKFYKAFVDVFFDFAAKDEIHYNALYVDTRTFKHSAYNGGDRDLGFSKLIFQLLLHKFGKKYGPAQPIHAYLDSRVTNHKPEQMLPMLNRKLRNDHGVMNNPFKRVTFLDSAKSDLIQVADLLTGCVGATRNGHHLIPGAAAHKKELREHIIRRAVGNEPCGRLNHWDTKRFYVWKFQFGEK